MTGRAREQVGPNMELFIDIPGPETDRLAVLARRYGTYIVVQGKARVARGSFTPPAQAFPGARYIAPGESLEETDWEQVRSLWPEPGEES
jgi:hypothetical protein